MNDVYFPGTQIIIDNKFDELTICRKLKLCLKDMNMIDMTPIQSKCIPYLIEGHDLLGAAKTGSGKTLAFLVPLVEKIMKEGVTPDQGTLAIILSPTRELSMQTFAVLEQLIDGTCLSAGVVIGGNNRDVEAHHLSNGVNILVATPGRLLDHMSRTKSFRFSQLHTLVIDEADELMDKGFINEMRAIINKLPKQRQTILFSATLNITAAKLKKKMKVKDNSEKKKMKTEDKVLTLACFSLKENCICIDLSMNDANKMIANKIETSTVAQLSQKYVICNADERFKMLYSIIKSRPNEKVMVFMATCLEVEFYYRFFKFIHEDGPTCTPVLALHKQQKQSKREKNLDQFRSSAAAVLLCTNVAARGLDIPAVDLVVQYDPPDKSCDYIHRVGRTARAGESGEALLFVRPHEMDFLVLLRSQKVPVAPLQLSAGLVRPVQEIFVTLVQKTAQLRLMAEEAFKSVVVAYVNNPQKSIFDVSKLDHAALALNFGLIDPPKMVLNGSRTTHKRPHGTTKGTDPKRRRKNQPLSQI